jgi:ATP-dependent Lhr-like helicase
MNALDPASVCGLGLEGLPGVLPDRRKNNRIVFQGSRPMLVIENNGAKLQFGIEPDHASIPTVLDHLARPLFRPVNPRSRITVKTINGEPADQSPYLSALQKRFDTDAGGGKVILYRKY